MEWKKKDVGIEQTFMSKSMVSTNIDKKQKWAICSSEGDS